VRGVVDARRVLVAPDAFGGTLSARAAAEAIAAGWADIEPAARLRLQPLSDGGPGFLEALEGAPGGRRVPVRATDALGRPCVADILLTGSPGEGPRTAWLEMARVAGLDQLAPAERDPRRTSTLGVAALVRAALAAGVERIVLGCGGSATHDGGAGLLTGLGVAVLDGHGAPVPPGAAGLAAVGTVDLTGLDPRLAEVDLVLASDVDNPLLGPSGAAAVFARQKLAPADAAGAAPLLAAWERSTAAWAERAEAAFGAPGARDRPGAGAAGGLGFAILLLGGRRAAGFGLVADRVGLAAALGDCDVVVTGEGRLDASTLRGKVVDGVLRAAAEQSVQVVVVAGQADPAVAGALGARGVTVATLAERAGLPAAALADAPRWARAAAAGAAQRVERADGGRNHAATRPADAVREVQ
jgi:glycerate kinase